MAAIFCSQIFCYGRSWLGPRRCARYRSLIVPSLAVTSLAFDPGKPLDPILEIGSCNQRPFADLADGNFTVRDQLIELRSPDRCHPTALSNRVEQLIHVGLGTAGRDGPGDRADVHHRPPALCASGLRQIE
jgi:hypothetical protein